MEPCKIEIGGQHGQSEAPRSRRSEGPSQEACSTDPAHAVLAHLFAMTRQFDKAAAQTERALVLDPNSYSVINLSALVLAYSGQHEEALPLFEKATRLNPSRAQSFWQLSMGYRIVGRYEETFQQARRAVELAPRNQIARSL